jgi:hypothetical protein
VVIKMDDEAQGNMGLLVEKPSLAQLNPELKGYGRVLDPAPLSALIMELASDQGAFVASSNEYARLKLLAGEANASQRALQAAQAAALHDQLAIHSAQARLALSWGTAVAGRDDLPALVQALTTQNAALLRIDLPTGDTVKSTPAAARIFSLSGSVAQGQYLGKASTVDPQTLGRGFIFLLNPNTLQLAPGDAVTGYLQFPGDPLLGVIIPKGAVVRTEGAGWVYTLNAGGDSFTRLPISLEHPTDTGWFVSQGITTNHYLVTVGAQTLLSEELKSSLKAD